MTRTLLPLLALMSGCGWGSLPNQNYHDLEALWDAENPVATSEGVYVRHPHSGGLTLVKPDGTFTSLNIGAGVVTSLSLAPDNSTVLAFIDRFSCDEDDARRLKKMETVNDCPYDKLVVNTEIATISSGVINTTISLPPLFNTLRFSEDGQWAMAYVDFEAVEDLSNTGVVDLTSVIVMNLGTGESTSLSVGFAADRVLFAQDASRAVVLSQSSVAVVDLTGEVPVKEVTFPLTLDADQTVDPVGVELTPDGRYALISVRGAGDLYVLDLDLHSVNLVSLSANPSAMRVIEDDDPFDAVHDDRTVVVYQNSATVDVMEHQYFDVESLTLDEPMSGVLSGKGMALLYTTRGGHDAYLLDFLADDLLEYRLENPAVSMHLAPNNDFAVALTRAENGMGDGVSGLYDRSPGMEILDLTGERAKSRAYLLEGQGIGLAFSTTETDLHAMVLQQNVEYLYQLNLYTGAEATLDLSAPAVHIGALPDGGFYITHDADLGLITFYDPSTGNTVEASGFGVAGLKQPTRLIKSEEGQ
jgi:hypothetical protein